MLEFAILVRGVYSPAQLIIDYHPELHMPMTPAIQQWMEETWQEKLAQARERGVVLFDAPLFRLHKAILTSDGRLQLQVGDTSYKAYVTTRTEAFASRHKRPELANPLAVCSVVETSDGYILLDKRTGVDVYEGRYHVIGGFFERERDIFEGSHLPDAFGAIRREIWEETGIQADDINEQYCLGVVHDLHVLHAELCFLTRLHISLQEIEQHRTPLDNEIKRLQSLHITEQSLYAFIVQNHGNISATGEPNLLCYGAWKFGEAWFEDTTSAIRLDNI